MDSVQEQYNRLLKALLPQEIFDYFEISQIVVNEKTIDVHLDEHNTVPQEYHKQGVVSKGFHAAVTIQDFPIRERAVFLHVRRRKWQIASTGRIVSNSWDVVAKGTRYTKGFASFLKEVFGQLPDQQ